MGILENSTEGVVLTASFDRESPTYREELREFEERLEALKQEFEFQEIEI